MAGSASATEPIPKRSTQAPGSGSGVTQAGSHRRSLAAQGGACSLSPQRSRVGPSYIRQTEHVPHLSAGIPGVSTVGSWSVDPLLCGPALPQVCTGSRSQQAWREGPRSSPSLALCLDLPHGAGARSSPQSLLAAQSRWQARDSACAGTMLSAAIGKAPPSQSPPSDSLLLAQLGTSLRPSPPRRLRARPGGPDLPGGTSFLQPTVISGGRQERRNRTGRILGDKP